MSRAQAPDDVARPPAGAGLSWLPRACRAVLRWVLERLFVFEIEGLERVPDRPYIVSANHPGWLETFSLVAFLPAARGLRMLASKRATTGVGWRKLILDRADVVLPLDLQNGDVRASVRAAVERLREGSSIGIFPEELDLPTPPDGSLRPLQRGVAFLARVSGCPVVPIGVPDTRQLWLGRRIRIRIGEPLPPPTNRAEEELLLAGLAERIEALRTRPEPLPARRHWSWLSGLF